MKIYAAEESRGVQTMKRQTNTAHWTQRTHMFRRDEYECSACGACSDRPYEVCPHCGAQMRGSKYDPSWVDEMAIIDMILEDD